MFILTFDSIFGKSANVISRFDGAVLIILCLAYMIMLVIKAKKTNMPEPSEEEMNINVFVKLLSDQPLRQSLIRHGSQGYQVSCAGLIPGA